jgi:hypothetical protein
MDRKFINTKQAAQVFGLSESYLAKMRHLGGGPLYVKAGSRVLYNEKVFEDWLLLHLRKNTSEAGKNAA